MKAIEYKGMFWRPSEVVAYPFDVPSTMAINEKTKLAFKGKLTLNFHLNSSRYSPEAVLSVYSRDYPVIRERAENNNLARMELPLPISLVTKCFLLKSAVAVDAKLKGIHAYLQKKVPKM